MLLFVSCNRSYLGNFEVLDSLRVLALKADPPEAASGATVTLSPLISDTNGAGRALTFSAEGCIDPSAILGKDPTCDNETTRTVFVTDQSVSGLSAPHYTGVAPTFSVLLPSNILDGKTAVQKQNGISYLVVYTLVAAGGPTVKSIKHIKVSEKSTKNSNPILSDVLSNGTSLTSVPTATTTLSVSLGAGSKESYTLTYSDGSTKTEEEDVTISWFSSKGTLTRSSTLPDDTNEWQNPEASSTLIVLANDGRGGSDYKIYGW